MSTFSPLDKQKIENLIKDEICPVCNEHPRVIYLNGYNIEFSCCKNIPADFKQKLWNKTEKTVKEAAQKGNIRGNSSIPKR